MNLKTYWTSLAGGLVLSLGLCWADTAAEFKVAEPMVSGMAADQQRDVLVAALVAPSCSSVPGVDIQACQSVQRGVDAQLHRGNWFTNQASHIKIALK